jgi:hypothetical protein
LVLNNFHHSWEFPGGHPKMRSGTIYNFQNKIFRKKLRKNAKLKKLQSCEKKFFVDRILNFSHPWIDPFDAEQKRRRKKERKEEKRREKEEKKAVKKAKKRERKEEEKKRKKHKKKNKSKNQDRDSDSDGSNSSIQPAQNQLTMKISLKNQQLGPDGRPRRPRGRPKKPERPKSPPKLRGRPPKDPKILAEKKAELMRAHADKEKKKLSENPDAKIQPVEPIKVKKTEVKKQEPEKVQTDKLIGDLGRYTIFIHIF